MTIVKKALTIIWFALVILLLTNESLKLNIQNIVITYQNIAPFMYVAVIVFFSVLILPCSFITVLAGMLWNFDAALFISLLSTMVSAGLTYFLGRTYFSSYIPKIVPRAVLNFANKLSDRLGVWSVIVCFVNPGFPSASLGYYFGHISYDFKKFILGALIGNLPLQVILLLLGHGLSRIGVA